MTPEGLAENCRGIFGPAFHGRALRRTTEIVAVLVAGLTLAGAVAAQPYETPPGPAAPRPLAIAAPSEQTLPNGMRVVVAHRDGVPLVTAMLVVLSGSETDPPALAGLASMTAGLLTQGTRHHTAPQLAAAAESLGGSLESAAGWNQSLVTITVTTPKIGAALGLVAEVVREPTFAAEEIERLRTQTLDGLKVSYARPGTLAGLAATRLAYGSGAYGHPSGGTPSSLPRIGRADLVAQHRDGFRPDRAVLILCGDVEAESALALARTHFGSWPRPTTTTMPAPSPVPAAARSEPAVTVVEMAGSGQAGVAVVMPLPERRGNDWASGDVLNAILGGGYSSRLNQEIRIKRGLSYGARSGIESRRASALLNVAVQTKNESAAEVVTLLQAELDRMIDTPATADELAARKATLIGDFSRSVETTAGLATAIRAYVVTGRSPAELTGRIESLEAIRPEDVQRYAKDHLGREGRSIAVAGEADRFGTALKAQYPAVVTIPLAEFEKDLSAGPARP